MKIIAFIEAHQSGIIPEIWQKSGDTRGKSGDTIQIFLSKLFKNVR